MTISNEATEAAAVALFDNWVSGTPARWEDMGEATRITYRTEARAALEAAAGIIRAECLEEAGDAPLPAPGRKGETSGFRFWLRARAVAERGRQ